MARRWLPPFAAPFTAVAVLSPLAAARSPLAAGYSPLIR